jgi:hypothetical protein
MHVAYESIVYHDRLTLPRQELCRTLLGRCPVLTSNLVLTSRVSAVILLANPEVPKFVCPTCLL